MGEEQTVHALFFEFLCDFNPVALLIEQTLLVDVRDVHELHAQFPQPVPGQIGKLNRIRSGKNAAPGGCKTDFDRFHKLQLLLFLVYGNIV